jgi:hypothetical protein
MKECQIYVEGKFDVPVYQVFLEKFLDSLKLDSYDYYALRNKVGIFHLYGGDQWEHFIDTVPSKPFKSLIILDGDKEPIVTSKLENESQALRSFLLDDITKFTEVVSLSASNNLGKVPIYCLKKPKIENYLYSKAEIKRGIEKRENVHFALKIILPEEIDQLFSMFLQEELESRK